MISLCDTVTLLAVNLSQDVFDISIVSEPRKVSVSTVVDGIDRERLDKMELMEEVLLRSCRGKECGSSCCERAEVVAVNANVIGSNISERLIRCII